MRGLLLSLFLIVLLVGSAGPAVAGSPIMLQFREVTPSPRLKSKLDVLARNMEGGETTYFSRLIAFDQFNRRITERFANDLSDLRSPIFLRNFLRAIEEGLGKSFFSNLADGSRWHFIRLRQFEGRKFALFRIQQPDDSLIYLDFEIDGGDGDGLRIIDWYDYVMSQWGSEWMAAGAEFGVLAVKLLQQGGDKQQRVIETFMKACRSRDFPEILSSYRHLPETLRGHPFAGHAFRIAATEAGDEFHQQGLAAMAESGYSIDRSFSLVDYYLLEGDYENARRALADFSILVGGDVALENLLASIYQQEGKYLESVLACEKAILTDPDFEKTYLTLLSAFGASGCYGDATLVLDLLESRFHYDFAPEHFMAIKELQEFAHSPELAEWLTRKQSLDNSKNPNPEVLKR